MEKRIFVFYVFIFVITVLFGCTSCKSVSQSDNSKRNVVRGELAGKVDRYLTRITPFGFSGALLLAKDGEIILNKGYGLAIRSEDVHNTSDTVFSTGSITKQFTAAGIMKLEMLGKLNTGDSIAEYFENVPEDKRDITLHHLLTHSAGVVNYTGMDYEEARRDETVEKILKEPLRFNPGEQFEYSNAGYSMLAAVIETVSGKTYEEFMHNNIFKPAGMEFTGYRMPEWEKKVVAHWYNGEIDNGTPLEKPYPHWNLLGNGGILSTTSDMYKWHLALLGDRVLSAEARKKIFTPYLNDYGYGWDVLDTERGVLIQHDGGSMLGSSAEFRRYLDAGVVTILFCNQSYKGRALFDVIRDKIEALIFGGGVDIPPPVVMLDSEKLRKFEGKYELSTGGRFRVKEKSGKLIISSEGQDAVNQLYFQGEADSALFSNIRQQSEAVFRAALEGDYNPFKRILFNSERRFEPVRQLVRMRLKMYRGRTGEVKEVKSSCVLPVRFNGDDAFITHVQLRGEKGSIFFLLYWKEGKNVGVGPARSMPELSVPFMLVSGTEFAGYSLEAAQNMRIRLDVDEEGKVLSLTIPNPGGDTSALKIKK